MKSKIQGRRNEHEDALLEPFWEVLPKGVQVTVLANRGFGDQALYELLKGLLGLDFVVRFRGIVKVESADGEAIGHDKWLKTNTVKHQTLSLVNRGILHCVALPNMNLHLAEELMANFGEMILE